jgi:hypothetical protein
MSAPKLTPLWQSVFFSDPSRLAALLKRIKPEELEEPGPAGTTVLFAAVEEYYNEATASSVGDYAGLPPKRKGGKTYQVLEMLLRAGANPNAIFKNPHTGNTLTPLSTLGQYGLLEGISLFLEHGRGLDVMKPSAEVRTTKGMWSIQSAVHMGHEAVVRALTAHPSWDGARDPRPLIAAAENDREGLLRLLLARGGAAGINSRHPDPRCKGSTALLTACYSGHGCVKALLDAGADVKVLHTGRMGDEDADDPFRLLSAMANVLATGADPDLIELLVQHGARRPQLEKTAKGGLMYVSPTGGRVELTNLLSVRRGPDVFDMRGFMGGERPDPGNGKCVDKRFEKYMCGNCGAPPALGKQLLRCGRCLKVAYCGADCQRRHWKEGGHKAACATPKDGGAD